MTALITGLGLILSVLIAYLNVQKNQRANLQLQEAHLRNELKLKLYDKFSTVFAKAGDSVSLAGTQYYSIISMFNVRLQSGMAVSPTITGSQLTEQAHVAQTDLNRMLMVLEEYEIVFLRFGAFRRQLSEEHSRFLRTHGELWSKLLMYLPFLHSETKQQVGPVLFPAVEDLAAIEVLHEAYLAVCSDISSYMIDLQIETQNELLGALFNRTLPPRHPGNPSAKVLRRDDAELVVRPKGRLV